MNIPKLTVPRWPKGERVQEPAGVIPLSLVRSAQAASWIAYFCLVYLLWLYTLDIARDRSAPLYLTHVGGWVGELRFWFPYIIGFAVIAVGIPYVAKIAIPIFMSLDWRTNAWPKAWSLFIAMSVSLVVFAGTFTIQGDTILEKGRDAAVAVAQVEQSKAVLQAQIAAKEAELKSMMENRNAYLAQAASVGAAEWQRSYIDKTERSDPQRERITRALGAARAADAIRAEISGLRQQAALSTTTAAVSERVEARAGVSWVGSAIDWIQGIRAILLSLVMDIVALLMPWIALRLQQARERQLGERSEEPLPIMIEDHTAEAVPQEIQPMKPAEKREQYFDEDGNKIVRRKATWAKVPTKKSGRKIVDPKTGKKVDDTTEYELAPSPDKVHLNEAYDVPEASISESAAAPEAQAAGGARGGAAPHRSESEGSISRDDVYRAGSAAGAMASRNARDVPPTREAADDQLTPEPEEKADAVASEAEEEQVSTRSPSLEGAEGGVSGAQSVHGSGGAEPDRAPEGRVDQEPAPLILADEEVAPPVPIDDERLDELIDKGVASEDENGFVTFHSQEDQEQIEQPDQTYNYPRLPAPKEDVAA